MKEEKGTIVILGMLATLGALIGLMAGGVFLAAAAARRGAGDQLIGVAAFAAEQRVTGHLSRLLADRLAEPAPVVAEELGQTLLPAWTAEVAGRPFEDDVELHPADLTVVDEFGKLSLTSQPYAAPFVLKHAWGSGTQYPPDGDIQALSDYLHLLTTRTPSGRLYGMRPDTVLAPRIQALSDLPSDQRDPWERRVAWGWLKPPDVTTALEDVAELINVWPSRSLEDIESLKSHFTHFPSKGLNINTTPRTGTRGYFALQGLMDWQWEAASTHPELKHEYQKPGYQAPRTLPPHVLPDPDDPFQPKPLGARFRGTPPALNNAAGVINRNANPGGYKHLGRYHSARPGEYTPYRREELIQALAVWPVIWPLSEEFHNTAGAFNHSITFHIGGPGPYIEKSDTYEIGWKASVRGRRYQGRAILRYARSAIPTLLAREATQ